MAGNVGSTLYVILKWNLVALNNTPCEYSRDGKYYHADCTNRNLINVPQNLNTNIESLDLSYNRVKDLDERYFQKYPNLKRLRLVKMRKVEDSDEAIQETAFRGLEKLNFLDISDSPHTLKDGETQHWASDLKELRLDNMNLTLLNAENLQYLEALYANNSSLRAFPKLHKLAPIRIIELEDNPIETMTTNDIASYCQLNNFRLKFPAGAFFQKQDQFCFCRSVQLWLKAYEIAHNPLNCTMPFNYDSSNGCPIDIPPTDVAVRDECLSKLGQKPINPVLIISVMVGLVAVGLIVLTYIYFRKRAKTDKSSPSAGSSNDDADDDDDEEEDEEDE